jgi:hypothetical protein
MVKKKKRKEKDQGRREGGSSEGKVPCALNQEFLFFSSREFGLRSGPSRLKYQLLRDLVYKEAMCEGSSRKRLLYAPIQRKQYLERTNLLRLKILLRSIRTEEGPHYCIGAKREQESCYLTSDNQPLFMSWISSRDFILGLYCVAWLT